VSDPIRWSYHEVARADSERGEVVLRERRSPEQRPGEGVLELRVNGVYVMDTQQTTTEQELARVALASVEDPRAVVVAGLGLGFTAREVLADHRVQKVAVVEVEEALVGWMRDGTVPHGPAFLADERLSVVVADIRVAVAEAAPASYDLVLLDVDNGPGALVHAANAELYTASFLRGVADLLRPGGAVAVWSATESSQLRDELASVLRAVTALPHDVRLQDRAQTYWLYLAHR
jgi:spermidine synthase